MKITITALRFKDITWSGGIFRKYEVKTDKTGDEIIELSLGQKPNEKAKIGDVVEGYIDNTFYMGKNGRVDKKVLKKVSAEYVYNLLLKVAPGIETAANTGASPITAGKPTTTNDGFDTPAMTPQDDGFSQPSMEESVEW